MAPVTPSPHRFVPGPQRQPSPVKESRLRQEPRVDAQIAAQQTPRQATSQFARAPRFAFGRLPQITQSSQPQPPPSQHLAEALRTRPADDVEEQDDAEDEDDEMLDVEQAEALPSVEITDDLRDLPYSPKRRRHSNEHAGTELCGTTTSLNRPTFKQPTTPASHITAAHFVRSHSVSGSSRVEGTQARRPAFLNASIAPSEQHEPLPEAFSPRRRGEKFVPGGMAATLQQWVIETGQNASQSRRGQGYLRGEDYVVRCTVVSVSGTEPLVVHGTQSDGIEVQLLLVAGSKQTNLAVGDDLGVRAPMWGIQLGGRSWEVGVDWRVIQ